MTERILSEEAEKKAIRYAEQHGIKAAAELFAVSATTVVSYFFRAGKQYVPRKYNKKCEICNIKFTTIYDVQKFCGSECRIKSKNDRAKPISKTNGCKEVKAPNGTTRKAMAD